MHSYQRQCSALTGILAVAVVATQLIAASPEQPAAQTQQAEPRLAVAVEMFCSQTKLRTSNARIRWSVPQPALEARGLASITAAPQSLDVTVYKNGFEKGLMVVLPIGPATVERPVVPQIQASARQPQPRAFQIRLIEVQQPRANVAAADAPAEMTAVVENLEPGVNYTWRIGIDAPRGRIVSPATTSQARVCPADMVLSPAVPRRK